jgi:hypothetical protein
LFDHLRSPAKASLAMPISGRTAWPYVRLN